MLNRDNWILYSTLEMLFLGSRRMASKTRHSLINPLSNLRSVGAAILEHFRALTRKRSWHVKRYRVAPSIQDCGSCC